MSVRAGGAARAFIAMNTGIGASAALACQTSRKQRFSAKRIALETRTKMPQLLPMGKSSPTNVRDALIKRLTSYWKMEAGNVVLVPAIMLFLASGKVGIAAFVAIMPMMALLAVGAWYWRAKLHQIERGISPDKTIMKIATLNMPLAIASLVAVSACITAWLVPGLAVGTADRWVATAAAILAVLEYINYYHRQLQHFDHLADWKRLLSGGGFRKSQLRQDIDRVTRA
ncbi:hypothetical protein [Qipengyuania sp. DGS5-3]|uniref:hypothetical protein n=1 Tax=Qipengyuania sp. DGS5-3 TaxID=3349632 RepID=UPI0036D3555C